MLRLISGGTEGSEGRGPCEVSPGRSACPAQPPCPWTPWLQALAPAHPASHSRRSCPSPASEQNPATERPEGLPLFLRRRKEKTTNRIEALGKVLKVGFEVLREKHVHVTSGFLPKSKQIQQGKPRRHRYRGGQSRGFRWSCEATALRRLSTWKSERSLENCALTKSCSAYVPFRIV